MQKLFDQLFTSSIEAAAQTTAVSGEGISLEDLATRMGCSKDRVSQTRSRAVRWLEELFRSGACRDEEFAITISKVAPALRFRRNERSIDYVKAFWAPYLEGKRAVAYYPEPQFFKDDRDTYYRNHRINDSAAAAASRFFTGKSAGLVPSQSFVPSGFVVALVQLFHAFANTRQLELTAQRLRWAESMQEQKANVILMGTSSSVREIALATDAFLMASSRDNEGRNAVTLPKVGSYVDHSYKPGDGLATVLTKWVVVTRLRREDQFVTVFSGHSRAVEMAVKFFTGVKLGKLEIADVAKAFDDEFRFEGEFQILLGTDMTWTQGELTTRALYLGAVYRDSHHKCIVRPDSSTIRRRAVKQRRPTRRNRDSATRLGARRDRGSTKRGRR
ncbi:MAG TPA: hypothetical protein VI485_22445 [Vicinamibacterales bacterium]|nr:hypothetical protein [Vicinamibacterales bacterium]